MPDNANLEQALCMLNELRARLAMVERLVTPQQELEPLTSAGDITVLLVQVRGIDAAIPLQTVQEVVPFAWLTPIPEAPPWMAGLLDLGGKMLGVLDVSARIANESHSPRAEDFIVICEFAGRSVGLCVSAVTDVVSFPSSAVAPPPRDIPYAPYLLGTISQGTSPILLLSANVLLHGSEQLGLGERAQ
jgi:chemotaxis signal transduction protein